MKRSTKSVIALQEQKIRKEIHGHYISRRHSDKNYHRGTKEQTLCLFFKTPISFIFKRSIADAGSLHLPLPKVDRQ